MPSYFNAVCDTIFDTNQFVIENGVFIYPEGFYD